MIERINMIRIKIQPLSECVDVERKALGRSSLCMQTSLSHFASLTYAYFKQPLRDA